MQDSVNLGVIVWLVLPTCKALLVREVFPRKLMWVKMQVQALSLISFEATGFGGLGECFINSAIWTAIQIRDTLKSIGHFPTFCLYLELKQANVARGFNTSSCVPPSKKNHKYPSVKKIPILAIFRWRLYICMQTCLSSLLQGYRTLQGI